jgi:hypothetical protein
MPPLVARVFTPLSTHCRRGAIDGAGPDRADVAARIRLGGAKRAQFHVSRAGEHLRTPLPDRLRRPVGHYRDGRQRAARERLAAARPAEAQVPTSALRRRTAEQDNADAQNGIQKVSLISSSLREESGQGRCVLMVLLKPHFS